MSFINENSKEINCKIVYYGPALSGKSTSLRHIYGEVKRGAPGSMISLAQDDDRTLYFDFVPLNLGEIGGYTVRLHLYTIPGEVGYRQSRALISKGVDGVVFVADSQLPRMEDNIKSLTGLKEILIAEGHDWKSVPMSFAYNKRDLPRAMPPAEMSRYLNAEKRDEFETVAIRGDGVFDAF
ncbi:MAG: gliding-motility protein MglA, partial [Proteobacteria bacterium]|nr:gliding-motility protein MglA [Pseudomonadota bacterium]